MSLSLLRWMFVLTALLLTACEIPRSWPGHPGREIRVEAVAGANQDGATVLDIVFVYEKDALPLMPKTGAAWFENKAALLAGLGSQVLVESREIVPASRAVTILWPNGQVKPVAVLGFANYLSPEGQAVINLRGFDCAWVTLTPMKVLYAACD